jgi:hypothetical protein
MTFGRETETKLELAATGLNELAFTSMKLAREEENEGYTPLASLDVWTEYPLESDDETVIND